MTISCVSCCFSVRRECGAHRAYSFFRTAAELLEASNNPLPETETQLPNDENESEGEITTFQRPDDVAVPTNTLRDCVSRAEMMKMQQSEPLILICTRTRMHTCTHKLRTYAPQSHNSSPRTHVSSHNYSSLSSRSGCHVPTRSSPILFLNSRSHKWEEGEGDPTVTHISILK